MTGKRKPLMRGLLGMLGAAAALGGAGAASGAQLAFDRRDAGGQTTLAYRFQDDVGAAHAIAFRLDSGAVRQALDGFARFDPAAVNQRNRAAFDAAMRAEVAALARRFPHATITLSPRGDIRYEIRARDAAAMGENAALAGLRAQAAAIERDFPGLRVAVVTQGERFRIAVEGRMSAQDQRAVQRRINAAARETEAVQRREVAAIQRDIDARGRQVSAELDRAIAAARRRAEAESARAIADQGWTPSGDREVTPDYARIAASGAQDLADALPAFADLVQGLDRRAAIDRLLAFFQAIPYDPLTSRRRSGTDAGFALPVALLARNRGDCDTKSVAFASVLHRLMPDIPIAMVLLDGHALLALGLPVRHGDRTIRHQGRDWVLAEPVGPRLVRLGEIGDESKRLLRRGARMMSLF